MRVFLNSHIEGLKSPILAQFGGLLEGVTIRLKLSPIFAQIKLPSFNHWLSNYSFLGLSQDQK